MVSAEEFFNASILIVDDQAANVQLLAKMLRESGYTNTSATMDPLQVGALHRAQCYDLILLDLKMPGMDGFAVMQALQTDAADSYLPVIVLTAEPGHKLRALQAGAKDFISKPFDLVEVKTRIHNMLEVRLLHKKLQDHSQRLEQVVQERTAELRASEARFRGLTELASDWYWEQDDTGAFTHVSGPVTEMLGLGFSAFLGRAGDHHSNGWHQAERASLQAKIAARQPFLNFAFSRLAADGSQRQFRVSGEPMFGESSRYIGYRGIGVEVTSAQAMEQSAS
jgi:PAS domain S-box-containing protein